MSGPEVLQRTMWWFLALHFGFRARDESRKLCWGDIELQTNSGGGEMLVWLCERGTKTRNGQENGHQRPFNQKFTPPDKKDVLLNIIKSSRAIVQSK